MKKLIKKINLIIPLSIICLSLITISACGKNKSITQKETENFRPSRSQTLLSHREENRKIFIHRDDSYKKLELFDQLVGEKSVWHNYLDHNDERMQYDAQDIHTFSIKTNWKNNSSSYDAQICTIKTNGGLEVFINRPKVTNYLDMSFSELQEKFYIPNRSNDIVANYSLIKDKFMDDISELCNFSDNGKGWNTVDIDREAKWPVNRFQEGNNLVIQHKADFDEDENHNGYMLSFIVSYQELINKNQEIELSIKSEYVENDFWDDDEEWHKDTLHINLNNGLITSDSSELSDNVVKINNSKFSLIYRNSSLND